MGSSTLSASTTVAVPVILSGNPPVRGALPLAQNYPNNLFTLLTGAMTDLNPSNLCGISISTELDDITRIEKTHIASRLYPLTYMPF